jgi:hypothetical protein
MEEKLEGDRMEKEVDIERGFVPRESSRFIRDISYM